MKKTISSALRHAIKLHARTLSHGSVACSVISFHSFDQQVVDDEHGTFIRNFRTEHTRVSECFIEKKNRFSHLFVIVWSHIITMFIIL